MSASSLQGASHGGLVKTPAEVNHMGAGVLEHPEHSTRYTTAEV